MFSDVIILAGGSGTRLWPASNSKTPKQFLALPGGSSFFGAALERAFAVLEGNEADRDGRVVVAAGAAHVPHVVRACADLPRSRRDRVVVIGEPVGRNTGPALACAAIYLRRTFGAGRRVLFLTSDHVIGPMEAFLADVEAAAALSEAGRLAVFGIPPRGPETGYGYIEAAEALPSAAAPGRTFAVASFREKPDRPTAERFLASGKFTWNSGMYGFGVDFLLDEFRRSSPETLAPFEALAAPASDAVSGAAAADRSSGVRVLSGWAGLAEAYAAVKGISIDYAVAEKCRSVAVVTASFDWLDIGCWDEYARFMEEAELQSDSDGDPSAGRGDRAPVFSVASSNCRVDSDLPVALCGVEDLIVTVRSGADGGPPAVLICKRGESQRVKDVVEAIKAAGRTDLL